MKCRACKNIVLPCILLGFAFNLSGCRRAALVVTEAVAGREVADKMAHTKKEDEAAALRIQAEAKRQNDDPRVLLGQHLNTTWMEFKTQPNPMKAGQNAVWTLNIWQVGKPAKNRNWVEDLKYVNEKLLQMTVVSDDLSYFNRLYPDYRGDGLFITSQTLPRGGKFKIYADYTPTQGVQEVAQHAFSVEGKTAAPVPLILDKMIGGWAKTRVVSRPESQPDAVGGETYNVALMPGRLVAGKAAMLRFRISDAQDKIVTDLQPYLGAMGHAVILSADSKIYLRADISDLTNSDLMNDKSSTRNADSGHSDVMFQTVFPAAGTYKIWGQFQHKDRIITAPFVLNVAAK